MSSNLVAFIMATIVVALVVLLTIGHLFGLLAFLGGVAVGVVLYRRVTGRRLP